MSGLVVGIISGVVVGLGFVVLWIKLGRELGGLN